jgi:hypothetical protein
MNKRHIISSLLAFALICLSVSAAIAQEYVYGDPVTKKYYGINCSEAGRISKPVGFKSSAIADKAGYARSDGCTETPAHISGTVSYLGDKELGQIYAIDCWYGSMIPERNWITFATKEEAEQHGYKLLPCPPMPPPKEPKASNDQGVVRTKTGVIKFTHANLPRLIAITSEPKEWLGKIMTIEADVNISETFKFDENTYGFRLTDGSAVMNVYMEKSAARPLRNLILAQPAARGVHGQFTFFMDPNGYLILKEVFGKLVSYRVTAQ